MKPALPTLPIQTILPELTEKLSNHSTVILAAEPGSGKTTIVPLALLDQPWLSGKKIILLEPRRLAVRMAAGRLSTNCGHPLGDRVGYRIRFDQCITDNTKIEVMTLGILIRILQKDPDLSDIGLIIFDEFHERSLFADLALALCLDLQVLRDDLKLLLMSATMDHNKIQKLLHDAPLIIGEGRCFPVETSYLPSPLHLIPKTVRAIHQALSKQHGDILVFLPGAGEIRQVQSKIQADCLCLPLYGNLPQREQDRIFQPTNQRRVILATPIAETSLTIEGVTVVIDSGLMKTPRFSPSTGLTSLCTVGISKASATQRAGRAGRVSPGVCYRLWSHGEHHSRAETSPPEILGADLAPLVIQTLQWGVSDPRELSWIDPPRQSQIQQAKTLLLTLGITTPDNSLSQTGKKIARLPLHPRLALMIFRGHEQGHGVLACTLASLLQNRDIFRGNLKERSVDIEDRLEILNLFNQGKTALIQARGADLTLCRKVLQEARQYQRLLRTKDLPMDTSMAGELLAFAYPDRIAMKKKDAKQHILSSGRGVLLQRNDHLHHADFLVAASLDGGRKQGRIYLAASLDKETILNRHPHLLTTSSQVVWKNKRVEASSSVMLGKLELSRKPQPNPDPEAGRQCLLQGIQQEGIHCLNWQKKSRALQARIQSAHLWNPSQWPDVSDTTLLADLSWLSPYIDTIHSLKQLQQLDLYSILKAQLSWQEQQQLEQIAPSHLRIASGSKVKLTYQPGKPPILAVRLQELFGVTDTPTVAGGTVKVLIHLLSPASRPIQVTSDLNGFWHNTYQEVKKELKGRYPKHHWPDDPLSATATARIKPRKRNNRP